MHALDSVIFRIDFPSPSQQFADLRSCYFGSVCDKLRCWLMMQLCIDRLLSHWANV